MFKYSKEFVSCKHCNNLDTQIFKDLNIRKWKIKCNECKSEYTV